jgi:hypothetical protein
MMVPRGGLPRRRKFNQLAVGGIAEHSTASLGFLPSESHRDHGVTCRNFEDVAPSES